MALPSTQAAAVALLTTIVGILVGFVPNLAVYQAEIISIGGAVLGAVYVIANAIHAHGHATANAKIKVAELNYEAAKVSAGMSTPPLHAA